MTRREFGGDGAEGTPGTIPNPEVKLRRGEDRGGTPENSALPSSFLLWAPKGAFSYLEYLLVWNELVLGLSFVYEMEFY